MRKRVVFLVEFEGYLRCLYRRLLGNGFEYHEASDGLEALKMLETMECPPHVMIVDGRMGRMDGPEFVARVRNNPKYSSTQIIALHGGFVSFDAALINAEIFKGSERTMDLRATVVSLIGN